MLKYISLTLLVTLSLSCGNPELDIPTSVVGPAGPKGAPGTNGISPVITAIPATSAQCPTGGLAFTITDANGTSLPYPVCNGSQSPLAQVALLAPCGISSSNWKEQLILLNDGSLLGTFSENLSGQDTRLALIPDGSYIDTDESGCNFNINTSGTTRTLAWGAGSSSNQPAGWAAGSSSWTVPAGFNPILGE